jgi:hypothetical protein
MTKWLSVHGAVVWPVLLVAILVAPTVSWDQARVTETGRGDAGTISGDSWPRLGEEGPAQEGKDIEPGTLRPPVARLYGTAGLGFIDTKREVGADIPLGLALLLDRYRVMATASIFDIAMVEGNDRDQRYYRPYPGYSYCVDTITGRYVSDFLCSGGTDFTVSSCADLSYVVFNEVWFADKPAKVTAGIGYRLRNPASPYATFGAFFPSRGSSAAGVRLDMGSDFVHMGVTWGLDLARVIRRGP